MNDTTTRKHQKLSQLKTLPTLHPLFHSWWFSPKKSPAACRSFATLALNRSRLRWHKKLRQGIRVTCFNHLFFWFNSLLTEKICAFKNSMSWFALVRLEGNPMSSENFRIPAICNSPIVVSLYGTTPYPNSHVFLPLICFWSIRLASYTASGMEGYQYIVWIRYILPGAQLTPVLIGKDFVLEGCFAPK